MVRDTSAKSEQLPLGWAWVKLSDIADIELGNSPPGHSYNATGRGMPLINGPTEFGPGSLDHPKTIQFTDAPTRLCEPGDLLICVRGSVGRTNVATFQACIGRGIAAIRAYECQPYINYFITSQAETLLLQGTGSTFPSITLAHLKVIRVPLPPLSEQSRIVSELASLFTEIDEGMSAVEKATADLDVLWSSTLQSAVAGSLTRDFRDSTPSRNSAKELLAEVTDSGLDAEKTQRSRSSSDRSDQGSLFDDQGSIKIIRHLTAASITDSVPDSWIYASMEQLCSIQLGRTKNPSNRAKNNATPYLRAANITEQGLDLSNVLEMDFTPQEQNVYKLQNGDIVISEASGSASQVGKPAIWREELPLCCFQNTIIRMRPYTIESEYMLVMLQHCYYNHIFSEASAGVGINHLGRGRLSRIIIPVPPKEERLIIVEQVNSQLGAARAATKVLEDSRHRAKHLRDAVLQRAFRGELVKPMKYSESVDDYIQRFNVWRQTRLASQQSTKEIRNSKTMTSSKQRRPLIDVINEYASGITPEDLLREANYDLSEVDAFYEELYKNADQIVEEKPQGEAAYMWPSQSRVYLKSKLN